jgi:putative SOS response-associated peptidase YedK
MSGFFEWTEKSRRAWYIFGEELLSAAAIWESWTDGDQVVESCSMLTRPADDFMAEVHDRMPVFLSPEDFEPWLDDHPIGTPEIQSYLQKSVPLERHEVATKVNDLSQDSSELIQKIDPIQGSLFG